MASFLKDLNQKITVREKYISTINKEVQSLSSEIVLYEKEIKELDEKLVALKKDYAAMIYKSYKSKSQQSRTLFLFSSESFYQAYKRVKYRRGGCGRGQGHRGAVQPALCTVDGRD